MKQINYANLLNKLYIPLIIEDADSPGEITDEQL